MIIGLFLRHYKIYNNVNFIPVANQFESTLSLFVRNNGVGKSSILEALNTFFNNGYWNRTKNEKQDQTFLCPCILIKKDEFNSFSAHDENDLIVLELISNYLFDSEESNHNSKDVNEFIKIKNNFKHLKNDYIY